MLRDPSDHRSYTTLLTTLIDCLSPIYFPISFPFSSCIFSPSLKYFFTPLFFPLISLLSYPPLIIIILVDNKIIRSFPSYSPLCFSSFSSFLSSLFFSSSLSSYSLLINFLLLFSLIHHPSSLIPYSCSLILVFPLLSYSLLSSLILFFPLLFSSSLYSHSLHFF